MSEEWRPIPCCPDGYEISNLGRVRSWLCGGYSGARRSTPYMKSIFVQRGYSTFGIVENGKSRPMRLHVALMATFVGPRPPGAVIRHLDGDRSNNALSNLVYGTVSENNFDTVRHGTHIHASRTHCAKGHPFEGENLMLSGGHRHCRICVRANGARARAKARAL